MRLDQFQVSRFERRLRRWLSPVLGSELFALKWDDIDFSNETLNVSRAIYNAGRGKLQDRREISV